MNDGPLNRPGGSGPGAEPDPAAVERLARGELDPTDAAVLERLRSLLERSDPLPADLVERLQFGLMFNAIETELASLTRLEPAAAGARSTDADIGQSVTFTHRDFSAVVRTVATAGDLLTIEGWTTAAGGTPVELTLDTDAPVCTVVDETGHFQFDGVRRGLARFAFRRPGSSAIVTPAMEV
ncbi:MAG TPA: hypothetical protein VMB79_01555 [Jatrophihabitans sp.]|nr:hypothetical protein [Jatrophihabitans sp.]